MVGLSYQKAQAIPDPTTERTAGTSPREEGQKCLNSVAVCPWQSRKQFGLLNDPADFFGEIQSSPSRQIYVCNLAKSGAIDLAGAEK